MMQTETILEPDLPIIDPHHHLWDWPDVVFANSPTAGHPFDVVSRRARRYLLPELLADVYGGHNVRATVFVQCGAMYKAEGPPAFGPVGETEFVNGIAAMSASGLYGEARACAGIVGHADLTLGSGVADVLQAHLAAGGGRFRGIRHSGSFDADARVLGLLAHTPAGLYASVKFRAGFAQLERFGLSFDAWLLEPQLSELVGLARAFPGTQLILDHVGTPLGIASYEGTREDRFGRWLDQMQALAALPNVVVKLGGLGMPFCHFPSLLQTPAASSSQLAAEWKPYIEACIGAFGVDRCMFESNFPVDSGSGSYTTVWNAFKRLTAGYSAAEKTALYSRTAQRIYRLDVSAP